MHCVINPTHRSWRHQAAYASNEKRKQMCVFFLLQRPRPVGSVTDSGRGLDATLQDSHEKTLHPLVKSYKIYCTVKISQNNV